MILSKKGAIRINLRVKKPPTKLQFRQRQKKLYNSDIISHLKGYVKMYQNILDRPINPPETPGEDQNAFDLIDTIDKLNNCIKKLKCNINDMSNYIEEAKEDLVELESAKTDALITLSQYGYSYV
ncbi:MAG: hypothetical protein K0S55_410 [Clostridia bacterium]|jgi:hypothetical protein|nr:hypothetical protein [Clostridia bacterium]